MSLPHVIFDCSISAIFCTKWKMGGFIWFPFQLHCKLVSSGISSQSVQNILIWRVTLNERPILVLSFLRFGEMTSELITFNHLRCHSSSTALGTRTGYWKLTRRVEFCTKEMCYLTIPDKCSKLWDTLKLHNQYYLIIKFTKIRRNCGEFYNPIVLMGTTTTTIHLCIMQQNMEWNILYEPF